MKINRKYELVQDSWAELEADGACHLGSNRGATEDDAGLDIDEAIENIPIGAYHYRLLMICGLAYMADAIEVSLLSFIVVLITEEWNLNILETSSIAASVFAGSMVGNVFVWGPLGDTWGRRKTFIAGSSLVCAAGLSCALAPNVSVLLFCNFFVGIGVGCVFISLDLLAEILPCEWRGLFLMVST